MAIDFDAVLAGLIANALTIFVSKFGHVIRDDLKVDGDDMSLEPILQEALDTIAEQFKWGGPGRLEEVCLFLSSPEAELSLSEVYGSCLSPDDQLEVLPSARTNFTKMLASYIDMDMTEVAVEAGQLFDQLVSSCQAALSVAIDKGILSAHEGKSAYRHQIIVDGLASIHKRLEFMNSRQHSTLKEILVFENKYRKQIASRHGHIIPPHFDAARRLPIEKMFVHPVFLLTSTEKNEDIEKVVSSSDFISHAHRCIVLGNPGGGKSTFASYLCHQLATRYKDRLFCHRALTPIHVVLRDYGAAKKEHNCSLLEFIELSANSKYQIKPPIGAFEYLLLNGRAMVILDGLDELLDTSYRKEVTGDVESFCNLFPEVPILVTSRQVGYEQAPLDPNRFQTARLAPMKEEQINEYVHKWFASIDEMELKEQSALADKFLKESQIVKDLCSNPLMLSLICTIYRGERYIPRNRPDVYEKCAIMLFERWDKTRGIESTLPFEAHIRPAMMYLADWIYRDPDLQSGVTESTLVARASEYLAHKRYDDEDEARYAAQEFIEFCTGRAWVFTDTGTTESGERLYQFTHQTFLEYFAACYLVRTHETPAKLSKILLPRIAKSEWDVVAQLSFQIQNKNVEGAGDQLLTNVITQSRTRKRGEWNLLQFASRCLEFLIPSPNVIREIIEIGIERWIDNDISRKSIQMKRLSERRGQEFLSTFANAAIENQPIILRSFERVLTDMINTGSLDQSLRATEVALNLRVIFQHNQQIEDSFFINKMIELSDQIWESCRDRIEELSKHHFGTFMFCFFRASKDIETLVKQYGLDAVFGEYVPMLLSSTSFISPAMAMMFAVMSPERLLNDELCVHRVKAMSQLGTILLSEEPPWFKRKMSGSYLSILKRWPKLVDELEMVHLDQIVGFTTIVILGVILESIEAEEAKEIIQEYTQISNTSLARLGSVLMCRLDDAISDEIIHRLSEMHFTNSQMKIILAWLRKEINFSGPQNKRAHIG